MFDITMNHKDGTPLIINKQPQLLKKIDSYAAVTGEYNFCIVNKDMTEQKMGYTFYQGL